MGYSEQGFQIAKNDAMATYAPQTVLYASGFLAGAIITWLPLVFYLVVFVWEATFGRGSFVAESRFQFALSNLGQNWASYASVAWKYSIALGVIGVALAWLRALSCRTDRYLRIETQEGEIRMAMHQIIGFIGTPFVTGFASARLFEESSAFYILFIPIVLSGLIFNIAFQGLQNAFLRRFYRPDFAQATIEALKVFVPRVVGRRHAKITRIEVDREQKIANVYGVFESGATKSEVRQIVAHFLRGFNPVHVYDDADGGAAKTA